jgi:hypothetical protein
MQPTPTRFAASWLLLLVLPVLVLVFAPPAAQAYQPAGKFQTEAQAKTRCPTDVVVWLNLATRLYYPKGHLWYATSKGGVFVCRKEAEEEGNRPG